MDLRKRFSKRRPADVVPFSVYAGRVQVGLSISGLIQQPRGQDMRARLREVLDWVAWSRDAGFDYITTGQHFLASPFETLQPLPLLARLAPETGDMRLVATILMPLHQPVELAELTASLDIITGGRLTISASRGYREVEFENFGVRPEDATARMLECIECLVGLWSGGRFSYRGRHHRLEGATIGALPVQRPHPPLWMAANADVAVRRAGRLGLPWNINAHADYATVERQVGIYREAARDSGRDPDLPLPLGRELYCAPSRERALEDAAGYLGAKYDAYAAWGQDRVLPGRPSFRTSFEELARDRFIVGSPDDCAQHLKRYTRLGVGSCHLRMNWPGMPASLSRQSLQLFAAEVLPSLRAASPHAS
jgi:alkanesulfonate monooxygenase SsuD/methylene tetrahydromethanopterin reductase-like flavin-dependent oxidoreductase (luciferase family)